MRSDFIKVLTERPRSGSGRRYKEVRRKDAASFDEDITGSKVGMRKVYGWECKEFSDLLGPLKRYIQSRVGKSWDKTHSEVCAHLKGRNTVQQHLLGHLYQMVERDIHVGPDGKLHRNTNKGYHPHLDEWLGEFYVDPRNGILKASKQGRIPWRRKSEDKEITEYKISDGVFHRILKGIWYRVVVNKEKIWVPAPASSDDDGRYIERSVESRKQLNTKELASFGLKNKAPDES